MYSFVYVIEEYICMLEMIMLRNIYIWLMVVFFLFFYMFIIVKYF